MTLTFASIALLLQCKGFALGHLPNTMAPPVPNPPHSANTPGCGVRFWLPTGWVLKKDESKQPCEVGLVAPDWEDTEAESNYTIWFTVLQDGAGTPWRLEDPNAPLPGFAYEDGGWRAVSSVRGGPAQRIEGPNWAGLAGYIAYKSTKPEGGYQGVGEGEVAAIVGPDNMLLEAEVHGVWVKEFSEVLCSMEFQSASKFHPAPPHLPALPSCEDRFVEYSKPGSDFLSRIIVEWAPGSRQIVEPAVRHEPQRSPRQTRWLVLQEPNFQDPNFGVEGPWDSVVTVFSNPAGALLVRVDLLGHANTSVKAQWLNEKLLYLGVPWNKIVSTDMILDVETRKTVYREDANAAAFTGPCEHKGMPK